MTSSPNFTSGPNALRAIDVRIGRNNRGGLTSAPKSVFNPFYVMLAIAAVMIGFILQNYHNMNHAELTRISIFSILFVVAALFSLQRRAAAEIKQAAMKEHFHELYRRGVENQVIFYTLDPIGSFTRINAEFTARTGYSEGEVLGKNVDMILPKGIDHTLTPEDWRLLMKGEIWSGYVTYRLKSGKSSQVRCSIVPRLEDGVIAEFAVVAIDVSEHKRDLANSKFASALNSIEDEVFVFDAGTYDVLFANSTAMARERSGMTAFRKDLNARDFLSLERFEDMKARCDEVRKSNEWKKVYEFIRRNGTPYDTTLHYVEPENDQPMFVAVYTDTTERKQAERAKSEFVSTVSHELRTPLTSIKGALSLVANGSLGEMPEAAGRMITIAHNNCDRLTNLINDILDLEKIEAGKMDFDIEPLDICEIVGQAMETNKSYGDRYSVNYTRAGGWPEGALEVRADVNRLLQVLDNLMSNAAKFSEPGSKVAIAITQSATHARVSVRDTGCGIAAKDRKKVFGKFMQVDSSDARSKGGTGLGLPIARTIVERMGGILDFTSTSGEGTEFFFTIPLANPSPVAIAGNRGTILVCEDDPDIASILRAMLEAQGFGVQIAETGLKARELIKDGRFDGITLDLGLPGASGLQIMEEVFGDPANCDLPVIVISANAELVAKGKKGRYADAVAWAEKPIQEPLLNSWLEHAVHRRGGDRPRVLHVEADAATRQLVSHLIGQTTDVDEASCLSEAQEMLAQRSYDLIILETVLPDGNGCVLIPGNEVDRKNKPPVVLFSVKDDQPKGQVKGALVKSRTSNDEFLRTIDAAIGQYSAEAANGKELSK